MRSDQRERPANWPKQTLRERLAWHVINPAYGRQRLWRTRLAQRLAWSREDLR